MPHSIATFIPSASHTRNDEEDSDYDGPPATYNMSPSSPTSLLNRRYSNGDPNENTGLLESQRSRNHRTSYTETGTLTRRSTFFRNNSTSGTLRRSRHHSRKNSQNARFELASDSHTPSLSTNSTSAKGQMISSSFLDERAWYDQFTSTDWVHDSIADANRLRKLRSRRDIRGRLLALFDSSQGWILVAVIGCITALIAYFVDVTENFIFDLKEGYCSTQWFSSKRNCCSSDGELCSTWRSWSNIVNSSKIDTLWIDYTFFVLVSIFLATIACVLTLLTKTVVPSTISLSTLDENLAADSGHGGSGDKTGYAKLNSSPSGGYAVLPTRPAMVFYSAAGSGVAEVKVILSGFVLHGYLGVRTLFLKTIALIFSISSGLSLGKEGPYVHIASCVGNICCRLFPKYRNNDGKRREVLSASASSGVAVAFGAPIGGVLFGLEEVSYYFPPKTLFRTFFCCIAATLSLKFLNPYGTGKIVPFEVRYLTDWDIFEMIVFVILGVLGGLAGALFIKGTALWARSFRRITVIKKWPMLEVILVALVTSLVGYWNRYTKLAVAELLSEVTSPCDEDPGSRTGLCPDEADDIMDVVVYLLIAFIIKALLTTITFGIKVPAGIYVPSMVVGGLMGRIVGHLTQYFVVKYPNFFLFSACPAGPGLESCVVPGVYAMVAAGATMCGVTRLSVTLAVILFELTGSLNHVLPFSIAVLCAKWTADALEPRSIYDLLTDMNSYPFLDNKTHPTREAYLADIVPPVRRHRVIDISASPLIPARELRDKVDYLLMVGELDSGLPIVRDGVLMGLIPVPDLEYALDKLDDEDEELCIMSVESPLSDIPDAEPRRLKDFTDHIDPSPIALDVHSPIDLVYQCFVKLGLRYICVLRDGKYAGLVHKKLFVKFMKENQE